MQGVTVECGKNLARKTEETRFQRLVEVIEWNCFVRAYSNGFLRDLMLFNSYFAFLFSGIRTFRCKADALLSSKTQSELWC